MKVVTANFYRGNRQPIKAAALLRDWGADVVGVQEAVRRHRLIMTTMRKEYMTFAGQYERGGREVPVFLRKSERSRYLGDGAYLVSDRVDPSNSGIAPDRYLTWVRFEYRGKKFCLINIHPNAVVQNKKTGGFRTRRLARVLEYIKSMKALEKEIRSQQNDGFAVIVTGDLNWRKIGQRLFKWSPISVFKRTGLDYVSRGVDYVAWQADALEKRGVQIKTQSETGSDHPWIGVNFKVL